MGGGGGGGARLTPEFVGKSFLAGGVAGMCAKTTVAPLDRVKILLQAHNSLYRWLAMVAIAPPRDLGVGASLARVVKQEGPRALFRGNGAQMVREGLDSSPPRPGSSPTEPSSSPPSRCSSRPCPGWS